MIHITIVIIVVGSISLAGLRNAAAVRSESAFGTLPLRACLIGFKAMT